MQRKTWYSILGLDAMPLSLKNLLLNGLTQLAFVSIKKMWKILIIFFLFNEKEFRHPCHGCLHLRHFLANPSTLPFPALFWEEANPLFSFQMMKKVLWDDVYHNNECKTLKTIRKLWVFFFCHWFLGANWNYFLTLRWWEISQGWELWHG